MAERLLRAEHLGISFRGLRALDDVNFSIPQGAVMGLIGPNGAGKTTLFNLLTGVYTPSDGTVTLDGEVISGKGMRYTVRHGISRTFQNIRLFKDMTVLDNVLIGLHHEMDYRLPGAIFRLPGYWRGTGDQSQAPLSGRTGSGHEQYRNPGTHGDHCLYPAEVRHLHPAHRA